jgi:hypothetical protein
MKRSLAERSERILGILKEAFPIEKILVDLLIENCRLNIMPQEEAKLKIAKWILQPATQSMAIHSHSFHLHPPVVRYISLHIKVNR